jgi:hypothetical protein
VAGRYDAVDPEAEFQPGSRDRVLRNRLGITSVPERERRESAALLIATQLKNVFKFLKIRTAFDSLLANTHSG